MINTATISSEASIYEERSEAIENIIEEKNFNEEVSRVGLRPEVGSFYAAVIGA